MAKTIKTKKAAKVVKATKAETKVKKERKVKATKEVTVTPTEAVNPNPKFLIEQNIPMPTVIRKGGESAYAWGAMNVGDSVFFPSEVDASFYADENELAKADKESLKVIANRLSGATRRFTKKNGEYKFCIRTVDSPSGVRVWRVEA